MSDVSALGIVSRHAPSMAISDALEMVSQLSEVIPAPPAPVVACDHVYSHPAVMAEATLWAERNFGPENMDRKINVIRVLRDRFGVTLSEGKAISEAIAYTGYGIPVDY